MREHPSPARHRINHTSRGASPEVNWEAQEQRVNATASRRNTHLVHNHQQPMNNSEHDERTRVTNKAKTTRRRYMNVTASRHNDARECDTHPTRADSEHGICSSVNNTSPKTRGKCENVTTSTSDVNAIYTGWCHCCGNASSDRTQSSNIATTTRQESINVTASTSNVNTAHNG